MMHNHHHNPHQPFHNRQGIVFDSVPTEENPNNHQESAAALSKSCSAAAAAEEQTPLQRPRPPEHHAFANGANGYANDDGCAAPTLSPRTSSRNRHIRSTGSTPHWSHRLSQRASVLWANLGTAGAEGEGGRKRRFTCREMLCLCLLPCVVLCLLLLAVSNMATYFVSTQV